MLKGLDSGIQIIHPPEVTSKALLLFVLDSGLYTTLQVHRRLMLDRLTVAHRTPPAYSLTTTHEQQLCSKRSSISVLGPRRTLNLRTQIPKSAWNLLLSTSCPVMPHCNSAVTVVFVHDSWLYKTIKDYSLEETIFCLYPNIL